MSAPLCREAPPARIGALALDSPLVLAPMAGITDLPFRLLAREAGCGLVVSEMVSADGLVHGAEKTRGLLRSDPREKPFAVQLLGADPAVMAEAAAIAVEAGAADLIDINFGCAVRKVVKTGAGVALMRDPARARRVIAAVRAAVRVPLTIKMRTGWERSGAQAFEIAAIAEELGVDAVAIHARTASQKFRGRADRGVIAELKRRLRIPVIGNGDVFTAAEALAMRAQTGCDAVMVGRGAIGRPFLFTEAAALLAGRPATAAPTIDQRLDLLERYLALALDGRTGAGGSFRRLRQRLGWFVKGIPASAVFRQRLGGAESADQAAEIIAAFRAECRRRDGAPALSA